MGESWSLTFAVDTRELWLWMEAFSWLKIHNETCWKFGEGPLISELSSKVEIDEETRKEDFFFLGREHVKEEKRENFLGKEKTRDFFSKRGQGAEGFFWYFLKRITEGTGRGFIFWRGHAHWGVRRRGPGHHWFVKDQQPQILWKVGYHFPPRWERTTVFPIKRTSAHHRFYLRHALAAGHLGESSRLHLQWHERPCWSKLSGFL